MCPRSRNASHFGAAATHYLWKRKRLERDRSCEDDGPRVHHVFSYHLTLQIFSVVFSHCSTNDGNGECSPPYGSMRSLMQYSSWDPPKTSPTEQSQVSRVTEVHFECTKRLCSPSQNCISLMTPWALLQPHPRNVAMLGRTAESQHMAFSFGRFLSALIQSVGFTWVSRTSWRHVD